MKAKTPLDECIDLVVDLIKDNESVERDRVLRRLYDILVWVKTNDTTIKAVTNIFNNFPGAVAVKGLANDDEYEIETR